MLTKSRLNITTLYSCDFMMYQDSHFHYKVSYSIEGVRSMDTLYFRFKIPLDEVKDLTLLDRMPAEVLKEWIFRSIPA